jgi:hypothetical protein
MQDAVAAAKTAAQSKEEQCNNSDADVIDLQQAAERSRAAK